jgi:hypothetical protein
LHNIYSSPITKLEIAKEEAGTDQEVSFSSCQTDSEKGECEVNQSMYFFFSCEEVGHIEIEFPYLKIESNETENPNEIEENLEIENKKNREEEFSQRER